MNSCLLMHNMNTHTHTCTATQALCFYLVVQSQTVSQHFAVRLNSALGTCSYCGSSGPSTDRNVLTWLEKV